jgi:hypothetical protein
VLQWQALNREIRELTSTPKPAEPVAKPSRVLPADNAGCVELFILAPGGSPPHPVQLQGLGSAAV